jgi:hypothetical protein
MINAATVKALNKLKNQDVHLGNFLAEAHKTIEMIGSTAHNIAKGVSAFQRKNPLDWLAVKGTETGRLPRNLWCTIPNAWLQLQYGWNPLMSDIVGSMLHLYRRSRFEIPFVRVHSKQEDVIESTTSLSGAHAGSCDVTWQHNRAVNCFLVYQMANPTLAELSSLGLINPAEIVWELMRYSFVVDWFLPVGAWLSALTADVGYTFVTGGYSNISRMECKGVGSPYGFVNQPGVVDYQLAPPVISGRMTEFQRTCFSGSPVPGLYVKNPLSTLHAANAIALLAQVFSR